MFGYIECDKKKLTEEEVERYLSFYCGICKDLGKRFGTFERMCLNYDMAFLSIFLSSLYEPQENTFDFKCALYPKRGKHIGIDSKYTEYASDMTVALMYHKCLDDWLDEGKRSSKAFADRLQKGYNDIRKKYERQCVCIEESIKKLSEIEKDSNSAPDDSIKCSGVLLSEIFVYSEDFWSGALRKFGYDLGCFIYLMDAVCDYKKDLKKKSYNPIIKMGAAPEDMDDALNMYIGSAAETFESLPLIKDEGILRNVIYSGVWQKYPGKDKDGK